jgi:murein DD-endopeptidase MepM/ murein hydrolase activator NlpD
MKPFSICLIPLFFILVSPAFGEYPQIQTLKRSDVLYSQVTRDIETSYRAASQGKFETFPALSIFAYTRQKDDTVFSLSASFNLPYEALSSLNRLAQAGDFGSSKSVLIPNTPGIFVPLRPDNPLEELMLAWRSRDSAKAEQVTVVRNGTPESFLFFRGERFHAVERALFLKIIFRFPLDKIAVTSEFGSRADPFSGGPSFHGGMDLAAPVGTVVYAAREGTVSAAGFDEVLGNYVRILHPGGYETLYGHLSAIFVHTSDSVKRGFPLGSVGVTGRTTGPHLHFGILKNGKPINPNSLLP